MLFGVLSLQSSASCCRIGDKVEYQCEFKKIALADSFSRHAATGSDCVIWSRGFFSTAGGRAIASNELAQ